MKIKSSRLQQIIQEELSHVLSERAEELFVVRVSSSSPFSGTVTSYWPSNTEPFVGSKAEAEEQVIKAKEGPIPGKPSRFARDWRAVRLDLDRMQPDDPMRSPLAAARDAAKARTHNPDKNADGALDAKELEAIAKNLER